MRDLSKLNMNKIMNRAGKNAETSKANNPPRDRNERRSQYDRLGGFRNNDQRGSGWNARPQERRPREEKFKQTDESVRTYGSEFYNPYTFIPFPDKSPERHNPSFLTVDENTTEKRYTGVLNLTVETASPLLSMDSENKKEEGKHFKYKALKIGNDVIVPATSVRGSLRTLMTILSGGTLGYMDKDMWLCQRRDLSMNVLGKNGAKKTELAEVVESGDSSHDGKIQRGITKMVSLGALSELFRDNNLEIDDFRPQKDKEVKYLYVNEDLTKLAQKRSSETPWKLKLSGPRVAANLTKVKNAEGEPLFPKVNGDALRKLAMQAGINLNDRNNREIWIDSPMNITSVSKQCDRKHSRYYVECNWYKNRFDLKTRGMEAMFLKNDSDPETVVAKKWGYYLGQNRNGVHPNLFGGDLVWLELGDDASAKSLQWARWGRGGDSSHRMDSILPKYLWPDSMNSDNKVDMVTDVFGMVSENKDGISFASRVRCHNLVFEGAAVGGLDEAIQLAPLAQPHPGCIAFYRTEKGLNGYKVYRNAADGEQPWLYDIQGVFDEQCKRMKPFGEQSIVKTVDLLKSGQKGRLKISFRALSEKELSLLVTACKVDWKLGGGKPLGLGHCKVTQMDAFDENGDSIDLNAIAPIETITGRVEWYKKSQEPVTMMRYPRAIKVSSRNSVQRSGLQWFMNHTQAGRWYQKLPDITADNQLLYCYDLESDGDEDPPHPSDLTGRVFDNHGPNTSSNAESLKRAKELRKDKYSY
ncbi:hypothetical protein [uncultured Fibrobacter sp.]|uniref:hypothetical protein n=1 Tax=uncultured Fibrobacter sp. TaxID=261512 RepID=UPI002592D4A1|nr:hypothetical protein [uncultured Fibrobacter sp.]